MLGGGGYVVCVYGVGRPSPHHPFLPSPHRIIASAVLALHQLCRSLHLTRPRLRCMHEGSDACTKAQMLGVAWVIRQDMAASYGVAQLCAVLLATLNLTETLTLTLTMALPLSPMLLDSIGQPPPRGRGWYRTEMRVCCACAWGATSLYNCLLSTRSLPLP